MRRTVRLTLSTLFALFILFALVLSWGAYTLHQSLKQNGVSELDWSFGSVSLRSLELKSLSVTYQENFQTTRQITDQIPEPVSGKSSKQTSHQSSNKLSQQNNYRLKVEGVQLLWSDLKGLLNNSFEISALHIQQMHLYLPEQSAPHPQASSDNSFKEALLGFTLPSTPRAWQTFLFENPHLPWLVWMPKTIEIDRFLLSRECTSGLCTLTGQLSTSLDTGGLSADLSDASNATLIASSPDTPDTPDTLDKTTQQDPKDQLTRPGQLTVSGILSNPDLSNPDAVDESPLLFSLHLSTTPNSLPILKAEVSIENQSIQNQLKFSLTNSITPDDHLATQLTLTGMAPNPVWFQTLESWSGYRLSESALMQLKQQALTPVNLEASNRMPLSSLEVLIQAFAQAPLKTDPNESNQIIELAENMADVLPETLRKQSLTQLSTDLKVTIALPNPTPLPALGLLQGQLHATLDLQQGTVQSYQLQADGALSKHSLTEKLNQLNVVDGIELPEIVFVINSEFNQARSSKQNEQNKAQILDDLSEIPFDLTLQSITPSATGTQFQLTGQGVVSLADDLAKTSSKEMFTLALQEAKLSFQQPNASLKMAQGQPNIRLKNLKAEIPFHAHFQNQTLSVQSTSALLKGDLNVTDQASSTLIAELKQLNVRGTALKLNLLGLFQPVDLDSATHKTPVNWSLSSKQLTINSQLNSPSLQAKNLQIRLNDLQVSHPQPAAQGQSTTNSKTGSLKIKADYHLTSDRLEHAQLLPQAWSASGSFSGGTNDLRFSGRLGNASDLVLHHKSRWKNKVLTVDASLEPLFFLGGNPLKNSFPLWPEKLTLASGQMALQGHLTLNTLQLKEPLMAISATVNSELKQVSGLFRETAFSQISTSSVLTLDRSQFTFALPNLEMTRVNHGVIAGPVRMVANYQGTLSDPLRGVLKIDTLNAGIFNGQAWLDPQTFDLSSPFKTQINLSSVEIEELLIQHPTSDLKGRGLMDGTLPLDVDLSVTPPSFLLHQGLLSSQSTGGLLQYQPANKSALGKTNQGMQLVLDVLDDFHYTVLESRVSVGADKKLILGLTLKGQNPNLEKGRAVNLNINLEEDLPSLITSMQISNQVSETIKRRVQERFQQQAKPSK